jgi:hypothetical protein
MDTINQNKSAYYFTFVPDAFVDIDENTQQEVDDFMDDLEDNGNFPFIFKGENDKQDFIITLLDDTQANKLGDFAKGLGALDKMIEITDDIVLGKEINDDFKSMFSDESNKEKLESFIKENLTMDIVLEKITEFGMESLPKIYKDFLK